MLMEDAIQELRDLRTEVSCRIEHGADSNGHLEYIWDKIKHLPEAIEDAFDENESYWMEIC